MWACLLGLSGTYVASRFCSKVCLLHALLNRGKMSIFHGAVVELAKWIVFPVMAFAWRHLHNIFLDDQSVLLLSKTSGPPDNIFSRIHWLALCWCSNGKSITNSLIWFLCWTSTSSLSWCFGLRRVASHYPLWLFSPATRSSARNVWSAHIGFWPVMHYN